MTFDLAILKDARKKAAKNEITSSNFNERLGLQVTDTVRVELLFRQRNSKYRTLSNLGFPCLELRILFDH